MIRSALMILTLASGPAAAAPVICEDGDMHRVKSVAKVVDGDTLDVTLDLGMHLSLDARLRLLGINAPELHSKDVSERLLAERSKDYLTQRVAQVKGLVACVTKQDSFGRWLAVLYYGNGGDLNSEILAAGHARPYLR